MTTKLNELLDAVEYVQAMVERQCKRKVIDRRPSSERPMCVTLRKLRRLCELCGAAEDLPAVAIDRAECIQYSLERLESLDPNLFENYGDEETCLAFVKALKEVKNEN